MSEDEDKLAELKATHVLIVVGRLTVLGAALDNQATKLTAAVCHISKSPLLDPIIVSIEFNKKCSIIKARAKHITADDRRKVLLNYAKKAEKVYAMRNIAAHSILSRENDEFVLVPAGAYKVLSGLDLNSKSISNTKMGDLEKAISAGDELLQTGKVLLAHFEQATIVLNKLREAKGKQESE